MPVRFLSFAAALLVASAGVAQTPSFGIAAVSQVDPGRAGSSTYGDVWGYVAPDGTEYALLAGRGTGLSILDVTGAPAAPAVEVGFLPRIAGASDAKDVKVIGRYAYLVNERGPMQIVDLADPTNPVQVGTLDVQPGTSGGGAHNVAVNGDFLYVTGGRTSGNAGLRIYSVAADPTAPTFVGEFRPTHFSTLYYHDFEVRGTMGLGPGIYGDGVDVLDLSDPANPTLVSTFNYPGSGAHNTCLSEDGQTVYVGDEIGAAGNWTRVFDISDPTDVEFVTDLIVDANAVVHNCYVRGSLLYIAHYTEGLQVYDVTTPTAPVRVAAYDTYAPTGYGTRGAWTAYPYLPSGKVLVSDLQSGLFVIELEAGVVASASAPEAGMALMVAPNPAAGAATVTVSLGEAARVALDVVDVLGRRVTGVDAHDRTAGTHALAVSLDSLPAGVYIVRLTLDGRAAGVQTLTVAR